MSAFAPWGRLVEALAPDGDSPISGGEQYPNRGCGSQYCCAVTAQSDHTVEPAQLQPMLDREPEAVRPMEQGEHTDAEQHKFGQRIPYDCQQVRMVRRVEQPQRKRQSETGTAGRAERARPPCPRR